MAKPRLNFDDMTSAERVGLAGELWDSVGDSADSLPLTAAQADELDRRMAAYRSDKGPGRKWRDVLDGIEARYRPPLLGDLFAAAAERGSS